MTQVQVIENENFIKYADLDNCEVWLLNRVTDEELDERIVNITELTESLLPSSAKFPQLMTYIYEKHPTVEEIDSEGNIINAEMGFDYEVISNSKENFAIHSYVCDVEKITVPTE